MSKPKFLITFGCSWTFGVGVGYQESMTWKEYTTIAWDLKMAEKYSFRQKLCERYGYTNINFANGGSSNQRQFRLAKRFFSSEQFKQIREQDAHVIVLWGITSTARLEKYSAVNNQISQVLLTRKDEFTEFMMKHWYSHEHEIFCLTNDMIHWNDYFRNLGIKNYWFDTFNHHDYRCNHPAITSLEDKFNRASGPDWPSWQDYLERNFDLTSKIGLEMMNSTKFEFAEYLRTEEITNFAIDGSNRDLASQLAKRLDFSGCFDQYHYSTWENDTEKIKFLAQNRLLNPYSFHPTAKAHEMMAEIFDPFFKTLVVED